MSRASNTAPSETCQFRESAFCQLQTHQVRYHQLQAILDRILAGVNANAATMTAMQEELHRHSDLLDEALRSSFSIEKSGYKVIAIILA